MRSPRPSPRPSASHKLLIARPERRALVACAVVSRDDGRAAVGQEDAQPDDGAEDHRGSREATQLGRAEVSDDRGVRQQHQRLGDEGEERRDGHPDDLPIDIARGGQGWPSSRVVDAFVPPATVAFVDKYMNRRRWTKTSSQVFCLHTIRGIAAGQSGAGRYQERFFSTPSSTDCAHGRTAFSPGMTWVLHTPCGAVAIARRPSGLLWRVGGKLSGGAHSVGMCERVEFSECHRALRGCARLRGGRRLRARSAAGPGGRAERPGCHADEQARRRSGVRHPRRA